jgi:hypothetical protein
MATQTRITLAGGIKATAWPRRQQTSTHAGAISPAHGAFVELARVLLDATEAEEFRASSMSWDPAFCDPDVAANLAFDAVLHAARAAGDAPIVIGSDRKLVYAARYIARSLTIEGAEARGEALHFLAETLSLWGRAADGLTARRIDALLDQTCERLLHLNALLSPEMMPLSTEGFSFIG